MLDPIIIAAIVEVVYLLLQQFLPQFPISKELINAVIVALFGLFVFRAGVRPLVARFWPNAQERGLISKKE